MDSYEAILKAYLAQNEPDCGFKKLNSLLDQLWYIYTEFNPVEPQEPAAKLALLEPITNQSSYKRARKLLYAIQQLRTEHEREVFFEGVGVDARLALEILTPLHTA